MPKILIVEDDLRSAEMMIEELKDVAEILHADSIERALELFRKNPNVDIIIMDACVPGRVPNTMPLIENIRKTGFDNPIIACSTEKTFNLKLIDAGATHSEGKIGAIITAKKLLQK